MQELLDLFKLNKYQLDIKVLTRASENKIKIVQQEDGLCVRVYVTCVPENGKANLEVIKLLAKELGVAKSTIVITKGQKSSHKTVVLK